MNLLSNTDFCLQIIFYIIIYKVYWLRNILISLFYSYLKILWCITWYIQFLLCFFPTFLQFRHCREVTVTTQPSVAELPVVTLVVVSIIISTCNAYALVFLVIHVLCTIYANRINFSCFHAIQHKIEFLSCEGSKATIVVKTKINVETRHEKTYNY